MSSESHSSEVSPAVSPAHAHHGPFHTHCENCAAKLEGPYCHRCGQHDFEFHRSFRHVFMEALENFFHFEGKFFRNIVVLLFWPGRLTQEFNAGKRASQMPPFRLYLFVSVLFFFLLFLDQGSRSASVNLQPPTEAPAVSAVDPDTPEWVAKLMQRAQTEEARNRLGDAFLHSIPRLLLVCLPLFALYTRFLFRKSGQVYLQHLVLAVHFHTFVYLWLMFSDGWRFLGGLLHPAVGTILFRACMLWAVLYPVLMLRRLFQNSWRKTVVKTAVLGWGYGMTLGASFVAAVALIFAFG